MVCTKWQSWLGDLTKVCDIQEINREAILTWWQSEILCTSLQMGLFTFYIYTLEKHNCVPPSLFSQQANL